MSNEYRKMDVLKLPSGYLVKLEDGICSVETTQKGAELFGGKTATFYKAGCFNINIPYEILLEITAEAVAHVKKYEAKK